MTRPPYVSPPDPVTVDELATTYRHWPTDDLQALRTEFAAHVAYHQKRLDALNAVLATRPDEAEGRPS